MIFGDYDFPYDTLLISLQKVLQVPCVGMHSCRSVAIIKTRRLPFRHSLLRFPTVRFKARYENKNVLA